jgi:glucose/arabinose dehydrogenase
MIWRRRVAVVAVLVLCSALIPGRLVAQSAEMRAPLSGDAAFGDWRTDAPGVWRHIRAGDIPPPNSSASADNEVRVIRRPDGAHLNAPPGFAVQIFASGLAGPRAMRVAPNGDVFVAESRSGRISVLRPSGGAGKPNETEVFASGLNYPFGIAFFPAGPNPDWIYVANTDSVIRFPYRSGDLKARDKPETVVAQLPSARGHSTRDIAFSKDGSRMLVSVGSASNAGENLSRMEPGQREQWKSSHAIGAAWGPEQNRADVLVFDPQGQNGQVFATGIRNCVGMAVHPTTGDLWCSTNERDDLGDNTPPDYVTRVREAAFYGWPWYFIGDNEDPRLKGARPDLKHAVTVPDVLIQAHSASMQIAFNDGDQFPREYRGDGFVAEHGSWNRSKRTGYKVVRIKLDNGIPTGEYEDFVTGFVVNDQSVWGRPVGIAFMKDGSLLVSEDGNGAIWRVSYGSKPAQN